MPKAKTKKAVAKRMKLTATGKVKRSHAFRSHILSRRTTKRKRHLRKSTIQLGTIGKKMAELLRGV